MTTIKPSRRIMLRLSAEDAGFVLSIARKLSLGGSGLVSVSDVLRHALRVAAEAT